MSHVHPHTVDENCHCRACKPHERPCDCEGCKARFELFSREKFEYNTDPQRRCYNGCHFSSEWRWSKWRPLYSVRGDEVRSSLENWDRIKRSTCEFKALPVGEDPNV